MSRDPATAYGRAIRMDPARARERERRRYGPRRGPSTWIYWTVAVVGLAVFALLMRAVMEKTKWTAGDLAGSQDTSAPAVPVDTRCRVLVDARSGTVVDRCGAGHASSPTAQDARRHAADARR